MSFRKIILDFFKRHRIDIMVVLFYALVTFVILFFLLQNIGSALIPGDGLFTYWTMSWDVHSFLHDPGNLFNANIFYPNQNTLSYSEGLFVPAIIALPLFIILRNMIVVYNLMIFFSYILTAFGAYRLAKYYTKNNYASFIAGLIFGFSTFRIVSMGHFQNIMIWWIPFATLYLQKYFDTRKRKNIVIFSLLFSAQILTSWNIGAFFALFVVFLCVANWKFIRDNFSSLAKDGAIALAIIIILVGPLAYPSFKLHQETHFSYPVWEIENGSADIGGYIFPLPGTYMSRITSFLRITKQHWAENFNFLGYFSILLLIYYFLFSRKKISTKPFKIFSWSIPIFILLSFGPILRFIPGMRIPSLYYLVMPLMGFVRTPSRIVIIVLLCVSVSIAYIIKSIKIESIYTKKILFLLIPAFILFEFYIPNSSSSLFHATACPEVYSFIKNSNLVTAISELPIYTGSAAGQNLTYIYYSSCYNFKPIFNGYSGYFPSEYGPDSERINSFPDQKSLDKLKDLKISHIVLHLDSYPKDAQKPLSKAILENSKLKIEYQKGQDYLIFIR